MRPALATTGDRCCVCGAPDPVCRNYQDQPFCWPCANPAPKPRLSVYFEKRDAWVGVYLATDAVYVCPLPFLVFRWWRQPRPAGRAVASTGKPPFWRWYEPPRWFPGWLHLLTCTHCRGGMAWVREQERQRRAVSRG